MPSTLSIPGRSSPQSHYLSNLKSRRKCRDRHHILSNFRVIRRHCHPVGQSEPPAHPVPETFLGLSAACSGGGVSCVVTFTPGGVRSAGPSVMAASLLLGLLFIVSATCSHPPLPVATVINDQEVANDAVMSRVVTQLEALIQRSVRDATAELSSQLATVSSRLDRSEEAVLRPARVASRAAEGAIGISEVIPRLVAMEQALTAMASRQDSVLQTVADVVKRQDDVQQTLSDISVKNDELQGTASATAGKQVIIEETLYAISRGQEDIKQSISAMTNWQSSAQKNLTSISEEQNGGPRIPRGHFEETKAYTEQSFVRVQLAG